MIEKEFKNFIEENTPRMVEDIAGLVYIESVADLSSPRASAPFGEGCRRALEQMLSYAARDGMEAFDHEGYCMSITVGSGAAEIGIWNHLDVVPAGEDWVYPPFTLTQKGDFLIGRGVQDNKGPAMAVYYAMLFCKQQNLLKNIRVRQILGCQEESGMGDVKYYVDHYDAPDFSFVADCAFPVCCGEKGICRVKLESTKKLNQFRALEGGRACNSVPERAEAELMLNGKPVRMEAQGTGGHAAFPEQTENAIGVLAGRLESCELENSEKQAVSFLKCAGTDGYGVGLGIACEDEISGRLTCNAGVLRLEQGKLKLTLDIRYPVTADSRIFLEKIKRRAAEAGLIVTETQDELPCYMDGKHPFVSVLMKAWREATGQKGEPYVMGGGTYARHIPRTVGFGTGMERDIGGLGLPEGHGGCHSADETESLENLKKAISIYVNTLINIDRWVGEGGKEYENIKNQ